MSRSKRVLISGYYGFNNSGDDAILKAIVKDLKKADESLDIVVLSNNPRLTEDVYKIKAVNRFKIIEVIRAIGKCDLFISGGGSLLQDVTSTRSILYYLALMMMALIFRKPVMVYANGIGPINKKMNRILTRVILNRVDYITLRDEDSKAFLHQLGVTNENIIVTADPVFTLEGSESSRIDDIFAKEGIPTDKPLVGISIRKWGKEERLIENLSKAIEYMVSKYSVNVVLIPMHYPEDLITSQQLLERINKGCYIISNRYGVEDIIGIIRKTEFIIAMRLHSLIYAAVQNIPMIGIVYDPKIKSFLNSIDMNKMCTVEDLQYNELIEYVDYIWENREILKERLKKLNTRMKEEAMKNIHIALNLSNSR
ncbi:MAG TPA: polysaccharide pyruvyl transferase CsaB [Tissierellia bacterium]|nr:polysaccharide pyruvyl transferase CsaB [Tissierellia bacterium]